VPGSPGTEPLDVGETIGKEMREMNTIKREYATVKECHKRLAVNFVFGSGVWLGTGRPMAFNICPVPCCQPGSASVVLEY